jgi:hypothetical protein
MSTDKHPAVTVRIDIPDGNASSVWIVGRGLDWNGNVVVCPRACFETARPLKQFSQPGVYILRKADQHVLPQIYIGLADPIRDRLNNHYANKDFWEEVFVCVGDSGGMLNKAHIEHLEAQLISMARRAKRCDLLNVDDPKLPTLSISEVAMVEGFLSKLLFVLRVLGLNIFEVPPTTPEEKSDAEMFFINSKGVAAKGYRHSGVFVVLAGSEAVLQTATHASEGIIAFRKSLETKGVLKVDNNRLIFTQDYEFSSPSAAAQVVLGRAANGLIEWENAKGKSIKDLEVEAAGTIET